MQINTILDLLKGKKTYTGIAIIVAMYLLQKYNINVFTEQDLNNIFNQIGMLFGTILAIYGRKNAVPAKMKVSESGKEFIKSFESFHDKDKSDNIVTPIQDPSGYWTIGWGNRFINGVEVTPDISITLQEAEDLFNRSLTEYESAVREVVTRTLSQNEFDALVSFCFNVGVSAFKTSLVAVKAQENRLDRDEMLRWKYSKGVVLNGLVNRRNKEYDLYSNNK